MKSRYSLFAATALLACSAVCFGSQEGPVLFGNVQVRLTSGPISLGSGQRASSCVVNTDSDPAAVLIALLTADTSSLLAVKPVVLQPGTGTCLNYDRGVPPAVNAQSANVYAVAVPNGRLDSSGRIVQDRPGSGGEIVASLQIQAIQISNTPGQTFLYVPMVQHNRQQ